MSQELDDFLRRRESAASAPARASVKAAAAQGIQPDAAAQHAATARRYGVSPAVVSAAPELFKQEDAADEADRIITGSPKLGDWLATREHNAAMARDDLPPLSDTEKTITTRAPREGIVSKLIGAAKAPADLIAGAVDYWTLGAGSAPVLPTLRAAREDLTAANIARATGSGLLGIAEGAVGVAAAASALNPAEIAFRTVNGAEASPSQMILEGAGKYLSGAQQAVRPQAKTAEGRGILSGVESTPASVASVVGGAYLKSATAGAMLMGGVTGGQSFLTGRQAGLSTEAALAYGGIDAAVEYGTERLPLGELIGAHSVGSPFIERFVKSTAEEIVGEQVATFLQDFNAWSFIESNQGKPFSQFLAERPGAAYETALATLFTAGSMNIAAEGLHRAGAIAGKQFARAAPAERDAETLDVLGQISAASKVLQRDPGSFEDFVRQAADGTTAEDVFIDANQLATVLDQSGLSPEQAAEMTGIAVSDLQMAVQTGADVRIPIETYAARVANSDIGPKLLDHLRIDPESMSREEAKVFMQSAETELQSLVDSQTTLALASDAARASRDAVKDQIFEELNKAGRFSPSVNEAYATLHATAMANIAARSGMTAEELAQRYGLQVQSGDLAQPTFDHEGKPAKESPRAEGKARFAAQKEAEAAAYGEFADNTPPAPVEGLAGRAKSPRESFVQGWLHAREGKAIPESWTLNPEGARALQAGYDAFREREVKPDHNDPNIFNQGPSIEEQHAADPNSAVNTIDARRAAFLKWFGDSKVVDENGDPLVVYHGTDQEFDAFDPESRGSSTNDLDAALAYFFSASPSVAEGYSNLGYGVPQTLPVYLKMERPWVHDMKGKAYDATTFAKWIKYAQANGRDGVIFKNVLDDTGVIGGILSDTYAVFEPTQIKSMLNIGKFDGNNPNIMEQRTGQARAQIALAPDISSEPSIITLLRGADLSSFLHESGHFYWEVMTDLAGRENPSEDISADVQRMLDFVGVADLPTWLGMSVADKREHHEKIARAFEAYLFEDKSPNPELNSLFGRFASWLRAVYKQITALNVELTDEVRGVFDRMLASDQEIDEAQADQGLAPLLVERPEGVLDSEWAGYQREGLEATEEAVRELASRSLRDMQYAGRAAARELKRLRRESSENRKQVREEVEAELRAEPVYRATRYLRTGQLDDSPKVEGEPHKLYTPIVREMLKLEADMPLPAALNGMTSTDNGAHPSQFADMFGYSSADQMLHDLLFASPVADAIEAETDNRMRERYGELSSPAALEAAVQSAIHNDVRGRFVATELAMLQKAPGKRRALTAAATKLARDTISRLKLRSVRPGQYEAAERRESRLAAETRGNLAEAAAHKRNQLLQFHLAKEAHAARDEADSIRRYLSKFGNANTRKAIDKTFLDQIDALLEAVQLKPISDVQAERYKEMAAWIENMRDEGFEPAFDADFLAQINKRAWRELTVDEIRQLNEAVKNIEWLGRRTKELLTAKDKADLDQAANEVADSIRTFATATIEEGVGSPNWWDTVRSGFNDFLAMHRKFANIIYVIDGNKYGGAAWERFTRSMNEAGDRETTMNADATRRLAAIFKPLNGQDLHTRHFEPEIGKSISLETRLMTALNWGNSTNRARVMDGDGWTPEQVDQILAPLTDEHWTFVENVWNFIDSYWPDISAKQERVSGVVPEKVPAEPFQITTKEGNLRLMRGGYFPIKYDPDRSSKAEADTAAEILTQMKRGLYTNATTRRGHTKERVDTVRGRPIRKDLGVIFGHTTQVIHDLAWHETLIDTNRLLRHNAIDRALRDHYGPEVLKWMRKALEDVATGDIPAQNAFERSINYVRAGASISAMGWNLWTSLMQPLGLTQSISRIGVKHVAKGIGNLFGSPKAMNDKIEWVYSVSPFMQERARTLQREVNEIRNKVGPKSPLRRAIDRVIPAPASDFVADSTFYMMGKAQLIADLPTWLGQYQKSVDGGESPDRAALIADQAVIDSQSSGMMKDLAGVQRGGPVLKLWTSFYSYFSATYNLIVDRTHELKRKGAGDLPYFAADVAMLTFVPSVLTSIMYGVLKGGGDDDAEDWLKRIAADNLNYMLGTMIGVREIGGALTGIAGYSGPAGARVFSAVGSLGKQVAQGEVDQAALRSANAVGGVLLHYPSTQIDRTVRGLMEYANGDAGPQAVLVGPPPKK